MPLKFLEDNLKSVNTDIENSCREAKRQVDDVTLLAVTKRQSLEKLKALYQLGLRSFGENRVQEMNDKAKVLPKDIEWHLIGPLQSNKVRSALQHATVIHSVDSFKLLERIGRIAAEEKKYPSIFLQVNLTGEEQKSGFRSTDLEEAAHLALSYTHVKLIGLMTMGATQHDENETRAVFRQLAELGRNLQKIDVNINQLSMGMSGDFPLAIQEGSTIIRVGSSILGARDYN